MTRQIDINDLRLMTKSQAIVYANGPKRYAFEAAFRAGHIEFVPCGKRPMFTKEAIDKWLKSTFKLTDYTKEAKHGMPTFHSCAKMAPRSSLEALWEQHQEQKQKESLLRKYPNLTSRKANLQNNQS